MKNIITLFVLTIFFNCILIAQQTTSLQWIKQFGGKALQEGNSIVLDKSGNILTTGYFEGTTNLDPAYNTLLYNLVSAGAEDIFISKLDVNENFVWAKRIGGKMEDKGCSITVDSSGNVYTTGYFQDTVDFDPGAGVFNLISAGSSDIFISKLDPSGNFVWTKRIGGEMEDKSYSIVVDKLGNIYTTGYFQDTVDFDPGAGVFNLISAGSSDIFISKLDSAGNFIWAKSLGGALEDQSYSIKVNDSGEVYVCGYFQDIVNFVSGTNILTLISSGYKDILISKLDNSGNIVWIKQLGGTNDDVGLSLFLDTFGNVYTTGYFTGTADFDPDLGFVFLTSSGDKDIFVSKINSTGNNVWAIKMGGVDNDCGQAIFVDASGNVNIAGYFTGTADFNPNITVYNLISGGEKDVFISKLNSSGNFIWAKQLGGEKDDIALSLAVDMQGNVYSNGYFMRRADFNPGPVLRILTSGGEKDMFISKLDNSGNYVKAIQLGGVAFNGKITFNGSSTLKNDTLENVYVTGSFMGTVDFDPGPNIYSLTSAGHSDIFIAKLNASGNLVWVKQIGGKSWDEGTSITLDKSGYVFITGRYKETVDFDPGPNVFNLTTLTSFTDIFVLKLDTSGDFVWAKRMGGTSSEYGQCIVVDNYGNVFTAGGFIGTVDFDPGPATYNLSSVSNYISMFISKLDSAGNFVWAKGIFGNSYDIMVAHLSLDNLGNIYTTGSFGKTVDFDPGPSTFNMTSQGYVDIFISKFNSSGSFVWAKQFGKKNTNKATSMMIDSTGLYFTGYFYETIDFDPGPGIFNLISSGGGDAFILKLDISGNFIFAKKIGGPLDEVGNSIILDKYKNIYVAGYFCGTTDFDPDIGVYNLTSSGNSDAFILKLDASGNFIWVNQMGGANDDEALSMNVSIDGFCFVKGFFSGDAVFYSGSGNYILSTEGDYNTFICKLGNCTKTSSILTTTACDSYNFNGSNLINSGIYYDTLANISGCDSTITLNLTVNNSYLFQESYVLCNNQIYNWHGQTISTPGVYYAYYNTFYGCDSIYSVVVSTSYNFIENHSICNGETYNWQGTDYTIANIYSANYYTFNGCDSVYTLNLSVNAVDTSLTVSDPVIMANTSFANYQWLDCDNAYAIIPGETSQNFIATANGNYAVLITQGICSDTSACIQIISTGIAPLLTDGILFYPNPISNELTIEIKGNIEPVNFKLINSIGQIVFDGMLLEKTTIKTTNLTHGFYLLKLEVGKSIFYKKIIKE